MNTCTNPAYSDLPAILTEHLLHRFDAPGPRYTSYPTADRFTESFGPAQLHQAFATQADKSAPFSVYVHIPFCESVCYYCACNKIVTKHHERAAEYLEALERELQQVLAASGTGRTISQLHLGGGTPTFLSDDEIARLMASLQAAYPLAPGAEVSIEVDPRTVNAQRLARLRSLGFNRISFGVQDFFEPVQKAVHRVQSFESVQSLIRDARHLGFASINVDLIYGLPLQTPASFARTVAQVSSLHPDRIALYAYAHLPQRFKPQRRIFDADLPLPAQRVAMLGNAIAGFVAQGYVYIGMDHFALPGDALAKAKREGSLRRNFQGYSVQPEGDLIGLGVSAIGRIGNCYYQNEKDLAEYCEALQEGCLPVARGIKLAKDDLLRHEIIMALMCQGRVKFADIESAYGIRMHEYFTAELGHLGLLAESGLVELQPDSIQVTAAGWFLVRAVAQVFDRHLREDRPSKPRFSRVV